MKKERDNQECKNKEFEKYMIEKGKAKEQTLSDKIVDVGETCKQLVLNPEDVKDFIRRLKEELKSKCYSAEAFFCGEASFLRSSAPSE